MNCAQCHSDFENHLNDPTKYKVSVALEAENCGRCHKEQYTTFFTVNFKKLGRTKNPFIVRDALISALTRPEKDTLWHKDEKRTSINIVDFREGFQENRHT